MTKLGALALILWSINFIYCYEDRCDVLESSNLIDGELIMAHTVCRHGDRNIIETYPNDDWKSEKYWPGGYGQLTNVGKRQHFTLGQYFRKRYASLFPSGGYAYKDVYILSTDSDRALTSALANVAGFFPPTEKQEWKHNLNWQPVPVHTIPNEHDYLLGPWKHCARFDLLMLDYMNKTNYKDLFRKHQSLIKHLEINSGKKLASLRDILFLYETLKIEQSRGKNLPEWALQALDTCGEFESLATYFYAMHTSTNEMKRLKGGFLLKEILDRFTAKIKKTLTPDRSLWMYFAHDITIVNMLSTLGLFESPFMPPYASCLFFELYQSDEMPYVQIFFKKTPKTKVKALKIPNCGIQCALEDFYKLYEEVLPKESYDVECKLRDNESISAGGNPEGYSNFNKQS